MWIRLQASQDRVIHIAVCYFPPSTSQFTQRRSPYTALYSDIMEFSSQGEILLLGDFNARTGSEQAPLLDLTDAILLREIEDLDFDLQRSSQDHGDVTGFGRHLLAMGTAHGLVIYNGLPRWPTSGALTCFPHGGGSSTVDYLMGSPSLVAHIPEFDIHPIPIGADHTYLSFTLLCSTPPPLPPPPSHTTPMWPFTGIWT